MEKVIHTAGVLLIVASGITFFVLFNDSEPPTMGTVVALAGILTMAFTGLLTMGFALVIQRLTEIRDALANDAAKEEATAGDYAKKLPAAYSANS